MNTLYNKIGYNFKKSAVTSKLVLMHRQYLFNFRPEAFDERRRLPASPITRFRADRR